MRTKTCPQCAEHVKAAAQVCRYCGHRFPVDLAKDAPDGETAPTRGRLPLYAAIAAAVLLVVGVLGWLMAPSITRTDDPAAVASPAPVASTSSAAPEYPVLAVGEEIEWIPEKHGDNLIRQVGPLTVRVIGQKGEDDEIAPVVTVSMGDRSVTMTGEAGSDTTTHRIAAFQNTPGSPPSILLQSFTGGTHCCNHVQMVTSVGEALRVVDVGQWDGEYMAIPTDISGEGVADFQVGDQSFLYAFTAYAMSRTPPQILNVVGGKVVDVSTRPAFMKLYRNDARSAGQSCRTDEDGGVRNGACAAYVADAARSGGLERAWSEMLSSHSPSEEWEYPTGCAVTTQPCPESMTVKYSSYPASLLAFLKEHGYVDRNWQPALPSDVATPTGETPF